MFPLALDRFLQKLAEVKIEESKGIFIEYDIENMTREEKKSIYN